MLKVKHNGNVEILKFHCEMKLKASIGKLVKITSEQRCLQIATHIDDRIF